MIFQLAFNIILTVFLIYCYSYIGATTSSSVSPGDIGEAAWPQTLIALTVFFLILNILTLFRKIPKEDRSLSNIDGTYFVNFFKSKLFVGMLILFIYSRVLGSIGFIISSLILFVSYARLLGEKSPKKLVITSLIAVTIFYIVFGVGLGIMLPRGTGVFRSFALFIESLF